MLGLWLPVLGFYQLSHLVLIFQPILHERGQTLVSMPGNMDLPVGPPHAGILPGFLQGGQGPTR